MDSPLFFLPHVRHAVEVLADLHQAQTEELDGTEVEHQAIAYCICSTAVAYRAAQKARRELEADPAITLGWEDAEPHSNRWDW